MKRRLHYPIWMNLGPAAVFVWLVYRLLQVWPLPARVPVHFGASGLPNRWGSPWELVAATVLTPVMLLLSRAVMAEFWARHERAKRFMWIALLLDLGLAFTAGAVLESLRAAAQVAHGAGSVRFALPLDLIAVLAAALVVLDMIFERIRPWQPQAEEVIASEASAAETDLRARIAAGDRWAYWETQNPLYITLLAIVVSAAMAIAAVTTRPVMPWMMPVWALVVVSMAAMLGGLHVSVTPDRVEVRLGYVGLRLLRVKLVDLEVAEATSFSPLGDFGGWGIRYNGRQWGFFFRGTHGVRLRATSGKEWIIGSDDAPRLAAVIAAAREASRPNAA